MINVILDFFAIFALFGYAFGLFIYLSLKAGDDALVPEYMGFLALVVAFLWATHHVAGM